MRYLLVCLLTLLTSACVTYYDPMQSAQKPGVKVTRATIIDTAKAEGKTRVQLFYLSTVDGKLVENALSATERFNYGKGMVVQAVTPKRFVPANKETTIEICAETYNGAPILDLFRADKKKCESLRMRFAADATYLISGLIDGKSASVKITEIPELELKRNR
jgi:hypothetical protein